ncbi:hypothetical protein [Streptomyces sp. cg35]|uniref:hypothetical protein n=1 Tax=Streptomyces sp. cg35 TaxID=3421650 RepID=UPI003D1642F7
MITLPAPKRLIAHATGTVAALGVIVGGAHAAGLPDSAAAAAGGLAIGAAAVATAVNTRPKESR